MGTNGLKPTQLAQSMNKAKKQLRFVAPIVAGLAAVGALASGSAASTAETEGVTVLTRPRSELEPLGMRAGGSRVLTGYEQLEELHTNV